MGTDCRNKILNFHLSISLMRHNSHRSIQPSPSEQIALPIRGLNQPCTLGPGGKILGGKRGENRETEGGKAAAGFSLHQPSVLVFFFLPRLAAH